jgi:hypothetical protein
MGGNNRVPTTRAGRLQALIHLSRLQLSESQAPGGWNDDENSHDRAVAERVREKRNLNSREACE